MPSFDASDKYFVSSKPIIAMKKIILIAGIAVCSVAVFTNLCAKSINPIVKMWENAAFNWAQTLFDFGTIKQNVPVTHTFKFTNNGNG